MRNSIAFLLVLFLITELSAQNSLKVSLKRDSISVGELSELQWQLSVPSGTKVLQMPMVPDSMPSGIEVVNKKNIETKKKGAQDIYKQTYSISAYDSGFFAIPSFSAFVLQNNDTVELMSDSLMLYCTTVPVDTTKAVKDIKDIFEVEGKFSWMWLWFVIAGILIAAVGIYLFYKFRKRKVQTPAEELVWIDPVDAALKALYKMKESRSWFSISPKDFYTELVDILRKYLIYSRNIQAAEMLSSELIDAVTKNGIKQECIDELNEILKIADMAKFARFRPDPGKYENSVDQAISFVNNTKPIETNTDNDEMDK